MDYRTCGKIRRDACLHACNRPRQRACKPRDGAHSSIREHMHTSVLEDTQSCVQERCKRTRKEGNMHTCVQEDLVSQLTGVPAYSHIHMLECVVIHKSKKLPLCQAASGRYTDTLFR